MAKKQIESQHQIALIEWCKLVNIPPMKFKTRPGSKIADYLYSIPNGGSRTKAEAGLLKAEGVKKGVSDLHLPIPSADGQYLSLYIEMKKPIVKGESKPKLSEHQAEWLEKMDELGHGCSVCYGVDQAKALLTWYLKL